MDQGIINYIKSCRELGQSDKDIKSFLMKTQHNKTDIAEAFGLIDNISSSKDAAPLVPPPPQPTDHHSATKAKNNKLETSQKENKKDPAAIASFALGLFSILIHSTIVFPLGATVLGIWGIARTKAKGSGRWMAIIGLILGAVYLIGGGHK